MSEHVRERIAERLPGFDVDEAIKLITTGLEQGEYLDVADDVVKGRRVVEVYLPGARAIWPVLGRDGQIMTVLSEGMEIRTPTGPMTLKRTTLGEGVHRISERRYRFDPCPEPSLSSTVGKTMIMRTPAHARWDMDHPKIKDAFDYGHILHTRALGRGQEYVVIPDDLLDAAGRVSRKDAKAWVEEQRAAGFVPVKKEVLSEIDRAVEALHYHLEERLIYGFGCADFRAIGL